MSNGFLILLEASVFLEYAYFNSNLKVEAQENENVWENRGNYSRSRKQDDFCLSHFLLITSCFSHFPPFFYFLHRIPEFSFFFPIVTLNTKNGGSHW